MAKPRQPTEDETRLWREAMRDAVTLRPQPPPPTPAPIPVVVSRTEAPAPSRPAPFRDVAPHRIAPESTHPPGLDKRSRDRLRKGEMPIAARLDLHGLTRDMAYRAVTRLIVDSAAAGDRCLLIVTGKGRGGEPGVLRSDLPRWLGQAPLRPLVLAVMPARPQHGGDGAVYLLLRRRR